MPSKAVTYIDVRLALVVSVALVAIPVRNEIASSDLVLILSGSSYAQDASVSADKAMIDNCAFFILLCVKNFQ